VPPEHQRAGTLTGSLFMAMMARQHPPSCASRSPFPLRSVSAPATITGLLQVLVLQPHIVGRSVGKELALLVAQRTHFLRRAAHVQIAAAQGLVGGYQTTGAEDHFILDHGAIHDDTAHADQNAAADPATVQQHLVADGYIVTDDQRIAIRVEWPGVGDVQYAAVLHAGARTDADAMHVAANHRGRPDRTIITQLHITQHHRAAVHEYALTQKRRLAGKLAYIHHLPLELTGCRHHLIRHYSRFHWLPMACWFDYRGAIVRTHAIQETPPCPIRCCNPMTCPHSVRSSRATSSQPSSRSLRIV